MELEGAELVGCGEGLDFVPSAVEGCGSRTGSELRF